MTTTWLAIEPLEPLLIGRLKTGTSVLGTQNYIPGRLVRGSWANWLIAKGRESEITSKLRSIRIGNFIPALPWRPLAYASPVLLSMLTCKREAGFYSEPLVSRRGHGVVDSLMPQLVYHLIAVLENPLSVPFNVTCNSSGCGCRMEAFDARYFNVYQEGSRRFFVKISPSYYTHTRVALSRFRRTASEKMLYTTTALRPATVAPDRKHSPTNRSMPQLYVGRITAPHGDIDELIEALSATPIGAMRTRGYGAVKAQRFDVQLPLLAHRLRDSNSQIDLLWQDLARLSSSHRIPDRPAGTFFTVDLLAPGVFCRAGLPSLVPELAIGNRLLQPVMWLTRPDMAGGWSEAWGLPKPTNLAACAGSTYVYLWEGSPDQILPDLERLELEGIGERTDEGFGECWICHPFHQEVQEK